MYEFIHPQNQKQERHSISPGQPAHVNSRHASAWNPFRKQPPAWGNQALQRLLRSRAGQAKLTVSQPGDEYEQEADRVAKQVMGMPEPNMTAESLQLSATPLAQRCAVGSGGGPAKAPSIVHEGLSSRGRSLDAATRTFFEPRFGHDFSQVRVHSDTRAAESASAVNAIAYTVGRDVVFGAGRYEPTTTGGKKLLTHELAHIVQQQSEGFTMLARVPEPQPVERGERLEQVETRSAVISQAGDQDADALVAEAQARPDPADRLGTLNIPDTVPMEEVSLIKITIVAYFDAGTRNAEVDAVIPGRENRRVFYTLRFRPDNDVDLERIGEIGESPKLDPNQPDIARAYGYTANRLGKLRSWLENRYPEIQPEGETVETMRGNANETLRARAQTPEWFENNYGIRIFSKSETEQRLRTISGYDDSQVVDIEDFTANELLIFELSLESLQDALLSLLDEVRLGRQSVDLYEKKDGQVVPSPNVGGRFFNEIDPPMIIMYDIGLHPRKPLFAGGRGGINLISSRHIVHELGHAIEAKIGAREAFSELTKHKEGSDEAAIRPFTRYAEKYPEREFFAEAFSIFETDPEWVETNYPDIYAWFVKLAQSGEIPDEAKRKGQKKLGAQP